MYLILRKLRLSIYCCLRLSCFVIIFIIIISEYFNCLVVSAVVNYCYYCKNKYTFLKDCFCF